MVEITVRDGRAGRDRTQDSEDGGAILATFERDQPYDIGDLITLADGDAVVVIGMRENVLSGENWKQTVFVGETPRPRVNFNLGNCPGWSLQTAGTTTDFVRCVEDDEASQIKMAAGFCRKYAIMPTYRLLNSSFRVWQHSWGRVANAKRGEWSPAVAEDLLGAFVGWLLIWRLVLDQAEHDLSSRFGKDSDQFSKFAAARSTAYDGSRGYRIIEALRNLVQHRKMPTLTLNRTEELDRTTGQPVMKTSYRFPVSDLLNSPKCPATIKKEFRDEPGLELELPSIIDEAMIAMNSVLIELMEISVPELTTYIGKLRPIFVEASWMPALLRLRQPSAGADPTGLNIEMLPLHDLQFLIRNAPIQ